MTAESTTPESQDSVANELKAALQARWEPYVERLHENMARVLGLVQFYSSLRGSLYDDPKTVDDILRAAVVFAHATLEDFLRTLAGNLLPYAGENVLAAIPLKGLGSRAEKFSLGRLSQFRSQTVQQVIEASISAHLERSNYNDVDEITRLLNDLGLEGTSAKEYYSSLAELMTRRHQIVHRADVVEPQGKATRDIQHIEGTQVLEWITAVVGFVEKILPSVGLRHLMNDGILSPSGESLLPEKNR
jgi:RiboL-PSP-HEPN